MMGKNQASKIWDAFSKQPDDQVSFREPVVRCDSCTKLVLVGDIEKYGLCNKCGNRRFRNVNVINDEELLDLIKLGVPEDFLLQFAGVAEWLKHPQKEDPIDFQGV